MIDADQQRDELVERLFSAGLAMGELMTVYLGDTLGLYRALERSGSMTAPELAKETGTFERYAREWLEQQAAAGILTLDDGSAVLTNAGTCSHRVTSSHSLTSRARIRSHRSASPSSRCPAPCRSWSTRSGPAAWSPGARTAKT